MITESIPTKLETDRLTYRETESALSKISALLTFVGSRSDSLHLSNIANAAGSLIFAASNMEKENTAFEQNLKNLRADFEKQRKALELAEANLKMYESKSKSRKAVKK